MPPVITRPTKSKGRELHIAIPTHANPCGSNKAVSRRQGPMVSISHPALSVVNTEAIPTLDTEYRGKQA